MVEKGPDLATRLRVQLVSWRTLRRRAEVVDTTPAGDPIVEVESERLVLPDGARHFRRFVPCAVCGTQLLGRERVSSVAELQHPGVPALCSQCARPQSSPS